MKNYSSIESIIAEIEAYEDLSFDISLLQRINALSSYNAIHQQPLNFYTPGFKRSETSELACNPTNKWPAVSITGSHCKLQCDHCKAHILEPMIPATSPDTLWEVVTKIIENGAEGMLLTGGSNHRNEVEYQEFLPIIHRIKSSHPEFTIAAHTALVDDEMAKNLQDAGVDVAMLDIIGSQETITQVYHLKRSVDDFEASLAALCGTTMQVVPHIVIGLHYGELLGEWQALEMVARYPVSALVLVVVMPQYANERRPFVTPNAQEVGDFFLDARQKLPDTSLLLGCARPAGEVKKLIDAYAIMSGFNGIAHPSDGSLQLATAMGRCFGVSHSCCSINYSDMDLSLLQTDQVMNINKLTETPVQWHARYKS
jgi:uncharacterized radical SAM superfamily protein